MENAVKYDIHRRRIANLAVSLHAFQGIHNVCFRGTLGTTGWIIMIYHHELGFIVFRGSRFHEYLDDEKFSYYSLNLIFDVGDYFAEVIVRNNPSIHWGFFTKPKDRAGVNCPILLGFKYDKDFDPSVIVSNCAYPSEGIWNNKKLYEVYNHWKQNNV